ncbi:MAG: hypothetical protein R6W82_10810 [bacterium]
MARYWKAKTFEGFYVEGRQQEHRLAEQFMEALGGVKIDEVMGAGVYVWLEEGDDPSLRVKDIGDRTLVEVLVIDRSVILPRTPRPAEPLEGEEAEEAAPEVEAPAVGGDVEDLLTRIDGILGERFERADETPSEFKTKLDLKLEKWERPQPMAIASGLPTGEDAQPGAVAGRTRGGGGTGIGGILAMLLAVVVLGGAAYYMLTSAADDPYVVFRPGTQYEQIEDALGFQNSEGDLVIISAPARLDTLWGASPRFVRAEDDTVETDTFEATAMEELRVDGERMSSVIVEPAPEEAETTASVLDVASLTWNQAEEWERWFETEINRGILEGTLVRQDDALWLTAGDNLVELTPSDLLDPADRIRLRFAEREDRPVRVVVRYQETLPYRQVRTQASRKLFRVEVRDVMIMD